MREIVLVRHGMPVCDRDTRIRGSDFGEWVRRYESASLDRSQSPPVRVQKRIAEMSCLVTSTLSRSIESAAILAPGRRTLWDALFNEAGIPTAIPFQLSLRPDHWDGLARIAWIFGWSPQTETIQQARARAIRATERLIELASEHRSVALVGHGMLNTLIARDLRGRGWSGSGSPREYWGLTEFSANY